MYSKSWAVSVSHQTEAKVYIYLAKMDPQKAKDIAAGLRITKQQLYPVLNNLQKKGVVDHDFQASSSFFSSHNRKTARSPSEKKREPSADYQRNKRRIT